MVQQIRADGELRDLTGGGVRVDGELRDLTGAAVRADGQLHDLDIVPGGEASLAVETLAPSDIADSGARLRGTVVDKTGAETATCWFEWRESGATEWTETDPQSRAQTGTFAEDVTGLTADTTYEYRAVGELTTETDTLTSTGTTVEFTTSATPPYTLVDDFEDGVAAVWENSDTHSTTTATAREGSRAAYRVSGGALLAGPSAFDVTLAPGSPFMVFSVQSDTGTGRIDLPFGYDTATSTDANAITLDWDADTVSVRTLSSSGSVMRDSDSADLAAGTWYDVTVYWGSGDTIKAWVHTTSGTEVATTEAQGVALTGGYWGVSLGESGSNNHRVDFVRSADTHPYTGEHYSEISVGAGVTVIDTFADGTFADGWSGTANYATVADADATDGYAAHRTAMGRLYAAPGAFDTYPSVGQGYLATTVKFVSLAGFNFFVTSETSDFIGGNTVDCAYYNRDGTWNLEIRTREGGTQTIESSTPVTLPTGEYVTVVIHIDADKVCHFEVYDDSGTEIESLQAAVGPEES